MEDLIDAFFEGLFSIDRHNIENAVLPDSIDVSKFLGIINTSDQESQMCNYEKCATCKGECCKCMGCHFSPNDLSEVTLDSLRKILDTGFVSIDWYCGRPDLEEGSEEAEEQLGYRAYYLRMRNQNSEIVNPSWGGICCVLTTKGCPLLFKNRPQGARRLVPTEDGCEEGYSKRQAALDWMPYHDMLEQLSVEYEGR